MRSAVNVQGLPQVIVPDNRHVIGVANSIGSNIQQGMERRKAESNKERAAAIAKELVSGGVGQGLPEAIRPQLDPQAELQSQIVEAQKQKQIQQAEVQAQQAQKELVQRSNMQSMLNDPETKANLIELQSLDPQMARTVFTMLASADERERLQVAQEAQRANNIYQNAAYFAQQDLAGGKGGQLDAFLVDAIRQEHARGGDVSKLMEMHRANTDERIALIQRNLALSGTVLKMPQVERMTEKEAADAARDQARLQLDRDKHNLEKREFQHEVEQDSKEDAPDFKDVQSLRKEFAAETKPFVAVNDSYGRLLASAEDPSPAGDVALIYNFMKVLDPGSTVLEGEFATAENSGSVGAKISGLYNQVINGKRLTEAQRADFVDRAGKLYARAEKIHKKREDDYRELAKKNGFDPDDVVFNRSVVEQPQQPLNITVDY